MWSKYRVRKGEEPYRSSTAKLSEADIPKIRERLAAGEMLKDIAKDFGVGSTTIGSIRRGDSWSHVR